MTKPISLETINAILFEIDPMNTCCKENNCYDEYERIASDIASMTSTGETIESALQYQFKFWFESTLDSQLMRSLTRAIRAGKVVADSPDY